MFTLHRRPRVSPCDVNIDGGSHQDEELDQIGVSDWREQLRRTVFLLTSSSLVRVRSTQEAEEDSENGAEEGRHCDS